MKAMLLAAGRGSRLRPLTDRIPKCMIPIGGKPLLARTVEHLARFGITEIIVNVYHLPDAIMGYLGGGDAWGVHITFSVEREPLGTAGGVRNAAWFFDDGEPFLVWYGDNLSTCNVNQLYGQHRARGGLASMALHYREEVGQSGIIALDEESRIVRLIEKPRPEQVFSHWVNAGIYVLDPIVLSYIPKTGAFDFARDIFPAMLAAGQPLYGYRLVEGERFWWIDRPEDLERVRNEWEAAS
jgi:mannose-1-phosphate guanylyltransferase